MADANQSEPPDFAHDPLLPPEMARRAETLGVAKAQLDAVSLLTLAVLAGAFIALGAIFITTTLAGTAGHLPYGIARLLGGSVFALGLIVVVIGGAELFTGNNLMVMAWASRRITSGALLRPWGSPMPETSSARAARRSWCSWRVTTLSDRARSARQRLESRRRR